MGEYLRGAWFEAETLFGRLVAQDQRDVDARLMLASLLRHTAGRPKPGGSWTSWIGWKRPKNGGMEIERERQLLKAGGRDADRTSQPLQPTC